MIKWDPNKGWYDTNTGLALNSPEEEERQKKYLEDKNKFLEENMYDPDKDYSGDFGKLFGSAVDESSELYYSGPNPRWQGALTDRLRERMGQKENIYGSSGHYEGSTGTVDRDLQRQMYRRNNAIEDMFRKGYSTDQILAHTEGKRNVLEEGPDYKDYEKAKAGQKVYGMKGRKDWADDYFDVPEQVQTQAGTEGSDQTGAGTDSGIASINGAGTDAGTGTGTGAGEGNGMPDLTQYFNPNIPASPGGKGGSGGGSGGGKGGRRPQQTNPFQSQTRRSGMYSSSPAGLGTGYYGGMGSGGRQFGDASYFGGFGGQRPQPSYGGKGGGMPQQPMYGGFSQPYQQSYQQPPRVGYSSFGGFGGSGGGIGGFYQPMGYGGYR
tara:strand:+ start:150 stop:1286 length:1137 start_codon:yes stop_codon:yes gene_type:complete